MKSLVKILCLCFTAASVWVAQSATLTFDDLATPYDGYEYRAPIASYGGLQWSNFYVFNVSDTLHYQISGYPHALVSPKNVAFNWFGDPAQVRSATPFSLNSAYLTAAWNDGLHVEVKGFTGATLTYDNIYTINSTAPTLINFNYLGVTEVDFIASGGTPNPAYSGNGAGTHFSMDNLIINVPEPCSLVLAGCGAALMIVRRRGSSAVLTTGRPVSSPKN
jgi:hypothetical protein